MLAAMEDESRKDYYIEENDQEKKSTALGFEKNSRESIF